MKSQLLEITPNYRICAHPKWNAGEFCTVLMLVGYLLGNAAWESNKPLCPKLPRADLMLGPGEPAWGQYKPLCAAHIRATVTYYLGSSYGGTVTSGPQPQPSPPQPWKREYTSSTFNRNKGCSQMYTNKSPTYLGSSIYSQAHHGDGDGLRKDLVPLALPLLGKAHVKRPWGLGMRGSGLHLSTLSLFRTDLSTRAQQHCTVRVCWKWGWCCCCSILVPVHVISRRSSSVGKASCVAEYSTEQIRGRRLHSSLYTDERGMGRLEILMSV